MEIAKTGKRATVFGTIGFFIFGGTYGLYAFSTLKAIIKLARSSAQGSSLATMFVALGIELAFFLGLIYLAVDGIVKYYKNHPTGTFPHAIRLIMLFALYSFVYPIYNKFLNPDFYFPLINLVTSPTGILLIITLAFSVASFFLMKKSNIIRQIIFGGVVIPMVVLDILLIIWTIPSYQYYWMSDYHLTIFGPWFRLLAIGFIIAGYLLEKKKKEPQTDEPKAE